MTKKPVKHAERLEVSYDEQHWKRLTTLRSAAIRVMEVLREAHIPTITHGSIARGDVTTKSDVDIFIPSPPSTFLTETALERAGLAIDRRVILQATPYYAVKGYIELRKGQSVSFPLAKMQRTERDFYRFGGELTLPGVKGGERVPGVDKRLMLIEPTARGHIARGIVGREEEIANLLGVSLQTVLDRVHALLRRDEIGRTGVFIEKELHSGETFELALKRLAESRPEVRRRLRF
jgi:predicted nucleotidyltransferase